jgi:hypothetical protein
MLRRKVSSNSRECLRVSGCSIAKQSSDILPLTKYPVRYKVALGLLGFHIPHHHSPMASERRTDSETTVHDETSPLLTTDPPLEAQTLTKPNPTPVLKLPLAALCIVRVAEPIAFTQIFPYVNEFLSDLHVTDDPSQIGFYSGLVVSGVYLSQVSYSNVQVFGSQGEYICYCSVMLHLPVGPAFRYVDTASITATTVDPLLNCCRCCWQKTRHTHGSCWTRTGDNLLRALRITHQCPVVTLSRCVEIWTLYPHEYLTFFSWTIFGQHCSYPLCPRRTHRLYESSRSLSYLWPILAYRSYYWVFSPSVFFSVRI